MKFTKKNWIAVIGVCAVVCGACVFSSIKNSVSKEDINKATEELAEDVIGGTMPDIDVKWELQQAIKELESAIETTVTTVTTIEETTTEITSETTVTDKPQQNSKPSKSSGNRTVYSDEIQQEALYEATVLKVIDANTLYLRFNDLNKEARFKLLSVNMPEIQTVDNILKYVPENEIENIEEIRQMILEDETIREENKQKIRVKDVICSKLKEGDIVYIEFDANKFPYMPSDKYYYMYLWYYDNEEDRANDRLSLFQEWLLVNGYAEVKPDTFNKKYLDYFEEVSNYADVEFAGLWNGFFKPEMKKPITLTTETSVTDVPAIENEEELQTETAEVTQPPIE